jgi:hypothetical protein
MKQRRTKIIIAAVLVTVLFGGCTLMSSYFMNEYHFWSLVGNGGSATKTLSYDSRGYTIVMSKGEHEDHGDGVTGYASEDGARAAMGSTDFTLTVNGEAVTGDDVGEKHVEQLDDDYWHIVQDFHISVERGGRYEIIGKTEYGGPTITGTLNLRITSWLIF